MNINQWLKFANDAMSSEITSARLDAELILAHTLRKPRTYLHAHGDEALTARHEEIANARLQMRIERTPVAYIIGHKEFYGRQFKTTPAVLIPRPESEAFIVLLSEILSKKITNLNKPMYLVDVGTGTGCLGITAKLEWPHLDVSLIDISQHALNIAQKNVGLLGAEVHIVKNNLLRGYANPIDIIIANLPYVDRTWETSPEIKSEPESALFATDEGLALITELIPQAAQLLKPGGHLLLESDVRQHSNVIELAKRNNFEHRKTEGLITYFVRV